MKESPDVSNACPPIAAPFSQSWIQALTLIADNPLARTIKPKLEWINALSRTGGEADRELAAKELWAFAESKGLKELLWLLPVQSSDWRFPDEERFIFRLRGTENATPNAASDKATIAPEHAQSFEAWRMALGLAPVSVPLVAEVFSGDWASLVRSEAVRLQQSLNLSAVAAATTLQLPCTAQWDLKSWSVRFDPVEWVVVPYEDLPLTPRPTFQELEEPLMTAMFQAAEKLVNKKAAASQFHASIAPWEGCVPSLQSLHQTLRNTKHEIPPWFKRTWQCVWPIVYREQHVLRELADLQWLRRELKACMDAQPRLCLWMFVYAKLTCQTQLGTGLGFCADFTS